MTPYRLGDSVPQTDPSAVRDVGKALRYRRFLEEIDR
jgi:hypothetical protein